MAPNAVTQGVGCHGHAPNHSQISKIPIRVAVSSWCVELRASIADTATR